MLDIKLSKYMIVSYFKLQYSQNLFNISVFSQLWKQLLAVFEVPEIYI